MILTLFAGLGVMVVFLMLVLVWIVGCPPGIYWWEWNRRRCGACGWTGWRYGEEFYPCPECHVWFMKSLWWHR